MPRKNPDILPQDYTTRVCELKKRYAQSQIKASIAISEFELAKIYPKDFKSSLPSIKELEDGLRG